MIDITVRTLNSQNYDFSVQDDLTVHQFKEHIAGKINVPAETQRIIFCGRVLADDAKLLDLDLHHKVVHLVERPPPSENGAANERGASAPEAPPPPGRNAGFGNMGGNTMYVGSMAIPFEPTNFAPPPPSARLAASRLIVARRMLRRAEAAITNLENPSARSTPAQGEEVAVEVTPVYEARVIVPTNATLNGQTAGASFPPASTSTVPAEQPERSTAAAGDVSVESTSMSTSNEDLTGGQESGTESASASTQGNGSQSQGGVQGRPDSQENRNSQATPPEEGVSRTSELAELLDQLASLQQRFVPFLERYRDFMRDDPTLESQDTRTTDRLLSRVSEVLHFFGHAYHSLSDMIVRARSPPPRRLICRPILIQQTAVVPAGFPIQVEAQINFGADGATTPAPNASTTQSQAEAATTTAANSAPSSTAPSTTNPFVNIGASRFPFVNISGLPPGAVHVQSIPIGIRPRTAPESRPNAPTPEQGQENQPAAPNHQNANAGGQVFANPNVEFFMEVTPESITIDSLEATVLGESASDRTIRPTNTPPAEIFQSILHMAGQLMHPGASTSVAGQTATPADAAASTAASQAQASNANAGQNSQARGNTQTNPTTATRTRSTARPHVHFSHHAIQGFDPFLPCNSHHILNLRRRAARPSESNAASTPSNGTQARTNAPQGPVPITPANPVYNLVQSVIHSLQNMYEGGRRPASAPAAAPTPAAEGAVADSGRPVIENATQQPISVAVQSDATPATVETHANTESVRELLRHAGGQTEGRGILSDLFHFMGQHLTVSDVLYHHDRIDPLIRLRNDIRTFTCDRVLEGNPSTPTNVLRAVNNLLVELQPFLNALRDLPTRDNIDIVRSIELLVRTRLPFVINMASSRRSTAIRSMANQLILLYRHLCALIMHASENGTQGIVDTFVHIANVFLEGLPDNTLTWCRSIISEQVRASLQSINVPESTLEPYIIRTLDLDEAEGSSDAAEWQSVESNNANGEVPAEECVLGEVDAEEAEQLPPMDIEPEQWHEDVPADWVPIIARDAQRQRRQSQAPLSDAYLSGMPNKRRKVVKNNKPIGSIQQVISDGIRRAVNTSGLTAAANVETVAQEAGSDLNIQAAYRDMLRSNVQSRLQDNEDFTPERFPNATAYFNKP